MRYFSYTDNNNLRFTGILCLSIRNMNIIAPDSSALNVFYATRSDQFDKKFVLGSTDISILQVPSQLAPAFNETDRNNYAEGKS